ncbi:rhomboid family intramembrane serine protease [Flaviaesturariibacter flavus]|uniref:Rhomboid family intramembrane serine protease n=1 Tax=Flaviaesturariibacter flavus TaxID=2502780 RepID=A0A4R1BAL9_9BACT|nr:rhomboid family intramembrane serine protease [Flaviaesturariibacter flavus]TCJ14011.1 rhomboid family intramembrane serine protease [Flaviaesturariibacter flavus]
MSRFDYYRPNAMPPVVKNLIIINAIVFFAQLMLDSQYNITDNFLTLAPLVPKGLLQYLPEGFRTFQPYQIATHMFTHGNFGHILFNMFSLWTFGKLLETVWGPKRFLLFYLACGVGAALMHLAIQYYRCTELLQAAQANDMAGVERYQGALAGAVGASGAIMGLFAAFAFLFPNTELFIMFIPVPIKAKWVVLLMAAYDVLGGLGVTNDNIAHFAHLGGALTGFIIVLFWQKTNRRQLY